MLDDNIWLSAHNGVNHTSHKVVNHPSGGCCHGCNMQLKLSHNLCSAPNTTASNAAVFDCRVPSTLRPLLGSSAAPKDELYSEEQIRAVLDDYAAANSLQIDSSSVKLDKLMVSNLFNKKEPQMEGDACPLEEVVKRLLGKLQLFHKITRVTEQVRVL